MEGITTSTECDNNNNSNTDNDKERCSKGNTTIAVAVDNTSSDSAIYMSIDNSTEENTSAISNVSNAKVIMEDASEVDMFLETHHLSQYKYVLRAEGYEDLEDLCTLVYRGGDSDMFCKLIPKSGHRTKLKRLLCTIAQRSRAASPSSVAGVALEKQKQKELLLSNQILISSNATPATELGEAALDGCAKSLSVKCAHQTLQSDQSSSVGISRSEMCFGSSDNVDFASPTSPSSNDVVNERSRDRNSIPALNRNNKKNNNNNKDYDTPLNSLTSSKPPDHHKREQSFSLLLSSSSLLSQPSPPPPPEIVLKIIVVGQRGCGKTSFIERFVHDSFSNTTRITVGVDFSEKRMIFNSIVLSLQFWDVSGQEYSTNVTRTFYKNSCAAIVMYDAKDRDSLERAAEWKADIDAKVTFPNIPLRIPCILVGNKYDNYSSCQRSLSNFTHKSKSIMPGTNNTILTENNNNNRTATASLLTGNEKLVLKFPKEIEEFCNLHHFVGHFFVSAKTGCEIHNAMEFLVTAVDKMAPFSSTLDKHQNRLLNFSYPDNSMRCIQVPRGSSISSSSSLLVRGSRVRMQSEAKKRKCCSN